MDLEIATVDEKIVVRPNPCTFVTIRVGHWGNNEFRLWFPEAIDPLWNSGQNPSVQSFVRLPGDRLHWEVASEAGRAGFDIFQDEGVIHLSVTVQNTGDEVLTPHLSSCFQTWNAPDFYSHDLSQIWAQIEGVWKPLTETALILRTYRNHGSYLSDNWVYPKSRSKKKRTPTVRGAMASLSPENIDAYRCKAEILVQKNPRFANLQDKAMRSFVVGCEMRRLIAVDIGIGEMETTGMPERVTSPLVSAVSRDGKRAAAIAWEGNAHLFHNNDPWIGCLHSDPEPAEIPPGGKARLRGWLFFSDCGLDGCIELFEKVTGKTEQEHVV